MKNQFTAFLIAICTLFTWSGAMVSASAQSEASAISALSALPVASVVGASAVGGSVVALPVILSTAGTVLVIKTVESTARGTVYLLERASDKVDAIGDQRGRSRVALERRKWTSVEVHDDGFGTVDPSAVGQSVGACHRSPVLLAVTLGRGSPAL